MTPPKSKKRSIAARKKAPAKKAPAKKTARKAPSKKRAGKPAPKKRVANTLTPIQYNALQQAYFEDQSVNKAATKAGVSYNVAKKYIHGKADPKRGMLAIHEVWLDSQAQAQEEVQFEWKEFAARQLKNLQVVAGMHTEELRLLGEDVQRRVTEYRKKQAEAKKKGKSAVPEMPLNLKQLVESYDKLVRMMAFLQGEPDQRVGVTSEFVGWTTEEVLDYCTTGRTPDRFRVTG